MRLVCFCKNNFEASRRLVYYSIKRQFSKDGIKEMLQKQAKIK